MERIASLSMLLVVLWSTVGCDDEAEPSSDVAPITDARIGESIDVDGVIVSLAEVSEPRDDGASIVINLRVRVENRSERDVVAPTFTLLCGGQPTDQFDSSTYEAGGAVAQNSVVDGFVVVELADPCTEPTVVADVDPAVSWPLRLT